MLNPFPPLLPPLSSYSSAILACAASGQWEPAVGLLREMPQRGLAPSRTCYAPAIKACAQGRNADMALSLLREMPEVLCVCVCLCGWFARWPSVQASCLLARDRCARGRIRLSFCLAQVKEGWLLPNVSPRVRVCNRFVQVWVGCEYVKKERARLHATSGRVCWCFCSWQSTPRTAR